MHVKWGITQIYKVRFVNPGGALSNGGHGYLSMSDN